MFVDTFPLVKLRGFLTAKDVKMNLSDFYHLNKRLYPVVMLEEYNSIPISKYYVSPK